MSTLFAIALSILATAIGLKLWRHQLNPITTGVVVWTLALTLATVEREFLSPIYNHLNHEVGAGVFSALILSFLSFAIGVELVLLLTGKRCWEQASINLKKINIHDGRLMLLFAAGLIVYLYAFKNAGLGDVINLDPDEVAESRLSLHLGPLSFVVLFIDIGAVIFMARMFETKRYIYGAPMLIAIAAHMVTLHKSPTLSLGVSCLYLCLLYPQQAREMIFGNAQRKFITIMIASSIALSLLVMNALRGIGIIQMTNFEWTWFEQIYIYSGATAILNLSAAIEGLVPNAPPALGAILARPVTWHLLDREFLNPTIYFEGINSATYLIYPWSDFRWLGFLITPFLTGVFIMTFYRLALEKTVYGIVLGTIAFKAVIFSSNTDVVFDPTTTILVILAIFSHLTVRKHRKKSNTWPAFKRD